MWGLVLSFLYVKIRRADQVKIIGIKGINYNKVEYRCEVLHMFFSLSNVVSDQHGSDNNQCTSSIKRNLEPKLQGYVKLLWLIMDQR